MHRSFRQKTRPPIEGEMIQSLTILQKALNPPVDALVTETRISLENSRQDLELWAQQNQARIVKQQCLFEQVLNQFLRISKRIENIL